MLSMTESFLLHQLVSVAAWREPGRTALIASGKEWSYAELAVAVQGCCAGCRAVDVQRSDRVAVYLEKRFETVVTSLGAPAVGAAMVPINPVLKAEQVA